MSPDAAVYIVQQALKLVLILAGPPLLAGLVVGLLVSIFQAVTQIQEMTLSFVPKIIAVLVVIMIGFPWMIKVMGRFTSELILNFHQYIQ